MGTVAVGRVNAANLDAVTLDAYGTLVELRNPVPELSTALAARGQLRSEGEIRAGFHAEVDYYREHSAEGYDEAGLKRLQRDCAKVFLDAVGADLDPAEFAPAYAGAMEFDVLPGVQESLARLRALGLELAVVANWDLSLLRMLADVRLVHPFRVVVHAAGKPGPDGLLRALDELHVEPRRALHVGDDDADERAAHAAGTHFGRAPLPAVVARLA
jgi:HAD superfamily hydrolase (TIGR01509 family)